MLSFMLLKSAEERLKVLDVLALVVLRVLIAFAEG